MRGIEPRTNLSTPVVYVHASWWRLYGASPLLEPTKGVEPLTYGLRYRCSPRISTPREREAGSLRHEVSSVRGATSADNEILPNT